MLQVLRIPTTADFILQRDPSPDMFRSLSTELGAHFARGPAQEFRHLRTSCSCFGLSVRLYTKDESSSYSPRSSSFTFSTSYFVPISDVMLAAATQIAFDNLPITHIDTVFLLRSALRPLWDDGLARLQHVKSITIQDQQRMNQPNILFESGQHGLVHYFPELKEIEITNTDLCDQYPHPGGQSSQAALLSILTRRSEAQPAPSQLERLRISDCSLSFGNVWRFKAVVPIVEVKGGRGGKYSDGKANNHRMSHRT